MKNATAVQPQQTTRNGHKMPTFTEESYRKLLDGASRGGKNSHKNMKAKAELDRAQRGTRARAQRPQQPVRFAPSEVRQIVIGQA